MPSLRVENSFNLYVLVFALRISIFHTSGLEQRFIMYAVTLTRIVDLWFACIITNIAVVSCCLHHNKKKSTWLQFSPTFLSLSITISLMVSVQLEWNSIRNTATEHPPLVFFTLCCVYTLIINCVEFLEIYQFLHNIHSSLTVLPCIHIDFTVAITIASIVQCVLFGLGAFFLYTTGHDLTAITLVVL
ncbi:hypothetical protein JMJ77_0013652, partial [Colletotrichum scovillei]